MGLIGWPFRVGGGVMRALPAWVQQAARMTEARRGGRDDARVMPSWSPSELPNDSGPPPAAAADEVEKARRLLEELFGDASSNGEPEQLQPGH